ncbi:hypothetical protein DL764_006425 [Monosporascus ibericus]|uniref:Uncharacterized protein n=1 Tax=Monosporascus ibericus TaxID=155417 RepID=A0A4Q4T768_9PEZI|nr:hypothetical protein DL764_006425 [Monosporascus ibericus]
MPGPVGGEMERWDLKEVGGERNLSTSGYHQDPMGPLNLFLHHGRGPDHQQLAGCDRLSWPCRRGRQHLCETKAPGPKRKSAKNCAAAAVLKHVIEMPSETQPTPRSGVQTKFVRHWMSSVDAPDGEDLTPLHAGIAPSAAKQIGMAPRGSCM